MATALHFDIDLLFVQPVTDGPVHHNHTEGIKQRTILGNARNEFAYFFIEPSEWTEVFRDSFCIDSVWYTNEAEQPWKKSTQYKNEQWIFSKHIKEFGEPSCCLFKFYKINHGGNRIDGEPGCVYGIRTGPDFFVNWEDHVPDKTGDDE